MDDTLQQIFTQVIGNSPVFALLLYMWFTERKERIKITQEYIDKLEELINGR